MIRIQIQLIIFACGTAVVFAGSPAAAPDASVIEFFEKKIRPILAENCHKCHSHKAEKLKAQLYLDTREGMLHGGESGVVVVPGEPNKSRLIEAVLYTDPDLQMPPKKKLPDAVIANLVEWVKMGAPWAEQPDSKISATQESNTADKTQAFLQERRNHWAYQPVRSVAIPEVKNRAWRTGNIDSFILTKLEESGLSPAPTADRRALIRRATYDLIGLPPTPAEVEEFLRDSSPQAFARVVNRLLASPHYGERWARHWLDLVRYSETLGFEFDFDLYNVWRYRDYVIRALNIDLPYNQFVLEHLAGDLLPEPRRHPRERFNESIIATGFFWMGEGRQTPVDIRQEQADVIDGQIDVLGKAFLAQTIACARCHDHKFDAISTQDYYALAGYLKSSRYQQAFIDPPERITAQVHKLVELKRKILELIATEALPIWLDEAAKASRHLLAARSVMGPDQAERPNSKDAAKEFGLDEARLQRWVTALRQTDLNNIQHPLYVWSQLANRTGSIQDQFTKGRETLWNSLRAQETNAFGALAAVNIFEDFRRDGYKEWFVTGDAFGSGPAQPGDIILGSRSDRPIAQFVAGGAHSGSLSRRLQGELRSKTFTIKKPFVHFLIAGQGARLNLIIDGYTLIMNPMYGGLTIAATNEQPAWRTMAVDRWIGHRAYFEIDDSTIPMHRLNPPPSTARVPESAAEDYIELKQICFSDDRNSPVTRPNRLNLEALEQTQDNNVEALALAYQQLILHELEQWRKSSATADDRSDGIALLNWLLQSGLLDEVARPVQKAESGGGTPSPAREWAETRRKDSQPPSLIGRADTDSRSDDLAILLNEYHAIEAALPSPLRAPALADGTGEDEFVFVRGNYKTPGERVHRRPPEIIPEPGVGTRSTASVDDESKNSDAVERVPTLSVQGFTARKLLSGNSHPEPFAQGKGSGRLELARRLIGPSNPLLARVMVNRIWKHHFGEGIVRTPDDFGRMGQAPTHPELLDYLAAEFVQRGWSIKELHRLIMLSSTYQMSSQTSSIEATQRDPENRFLHHMPVRRLEAEAIRDAILAVSGRLNRNMNGPSVLPYLTPYMEGRGRPNSGPLDSDGRRSIYINARRNFTVPMLVAFDYPVNFSTNGRRVVSMVPEQAMTLMNDPFIVQQATKWAERVLAEWGKTSDERINMLYQSAFTRPPTETELRGALLFLRQQAQLHGNGLENPEVWSDLCHVLFNVKEFIFIN